MASYRRFLKLLSKWPVDETQKRMDYGNFLRQMIKDKNPTGNIFPGTSVENEEKLDSLYRLLNNTYFQKYPCRKRVGALGMEFETVKKVLMHSVTEDEKLKKLAEKRRGI